MKTKWFLIAISSLFIFIIAGCKNEEVNYKEHLSEIYSVSLNSLLEQELISDLEFIAIDMSNILNTNKQPITKEEQKAILNFFKNEYNNKVINASYEELIKKGLYNPETMVLDGILLKIEEVDFVNDTEVLFQGSKHRSRKNATGVKGIVHFQDNKWSVKDIIETWVN